MNVETLFGLTTVCFFITSIQLSRLWGRVKKLEASVGSLNKSTPPA